jgi:hypothetical protein
MKLPYNVRSFSLKLEVPVLGQNDKLKTRFSKIFQFSEELYDEIVAIRSSEGKSLLKPQFRKEGATVTPPTLQVFI